MKISDGLDLQGRPATNVADPSSPQEAATKNYVDTQSVGRGELLVSVADFGAVPNNPSAAAANDAAFAAALASGAGVVFVPVGTWWVSTEVRVPSYTRFRGAGVGRTVLKMINGVGETYNVVTNVRNDRLARSTYDEHIVISDMSIDGNAENRSAGGDMPAGGSGGCCIALSMVRDSLIERVYARSGVWNNIDIAASRYVAVNTSTYAEGPSINVTVRDCTSVDPYRDDAFTSHFSQFVKFENCRAEITDGQYCHWNTNGFEIDEGSIDCSAVDCYAYRFSKGFQSKGHSNTPGAIRSTFDRCTADKCGLSFTAESTNLTGRNVRFLNCTSLAPNTAYFHTDAEGPRSSTPGSGYYTEARGLEVKGTDGCIISNLVLIGGAGNNIVLQDGKNYRLDGVDISDVPVNRITGMDSTRGFIQLWGDASENFIVRGVVCRTALTYRLVRVAINNPGTPIVVEDIRTVGNQAATTEAAVVEWKAGITSIERVTSSGYGGGSILPAPVPQILTSDSGYPVATSGQTATKTIDFFTIPPMPFARRITVSATVYVTASNTDTAVDLTVYVSPTIGVRGRARKKWSPASNPEFMAVTGVCDLAADTSYTCAVQLSRASGTGTYTSSISSSFTTSSLTWVRI